MLFWLSVLVTLAAVNLWTFSLFGWDKMQAEQGGWRVQESSLLTLALVGGIAGAYAGRALFRHKTRKKSFNNALQRIGFFQLVAMTFFGVYFYEPGGSPAAAEVETVQSLAEPPYWPQAQSDVYYRNCDAARRAGAAPIHAGQPGYRTNLDGDGDGIACEPYRRRF